jgi:mono/diheme cytochrome c family protein
VDASMHAAFEAGETLFGPKCGECHYDPAKDLTGQPLYDAVCFFCHGKERQGKTAPALAAYPDASDPYLTQMIARGRAGTEMPGFARAEGGPLSPDQVASLVRLMHTEPPPPPPEPAPAPTGDMGDSDGPFFK